MAENDTVRLPDSITFTGIDEKTDVAKLHELAMVYPVEFGVLISPKRSGNDPRYPGPKKALEFLNSGLVTAAHVCGGYAKSIMKREPIPSLGLARRVQINHPDPDIEAVLDFCRGTGNRAILQTRDELGFPFAGDERIEWLFDRSGGRGQQPESWPAYPALSLNRRYGYAGGLTPENVVATLAEISATGPYWIDMESGVRDEDNLFSIERARAVCEAVYGVR